MELAAAIRTRRSTAPVTDSAPSDEELLDCLRLAAHSPDHAGLRAWRLATLRGSARDRLGEAMAVGFGDEPGSEAAARTARKTLRAPLLVTIVGVPVDHPKVPAWEQLASIGALVATLQLALFDLGYTAMWRTGPAVDLPQVRTMLELTANEQLLGWLYVGGTPAGQAVPEADPDVRDRLSHLRR
jgi:nitroreductase